MRRGAGCPSLPRSRRPRTLSWLLTGFGGPSGLRPRAELRAPNDDGSPGPAAHHGRSPPSSIDITRAFPQRDQLLRRDPPRDVRQHQRQHPPPRRAAHHTLRRPFPIADQPMIAPWWGDVDTRGGGQPPRATTSASHRAQPRRRHVEQRRLLLAPTTTSRTTSSSSSPPRAPARPRATSTEFRYNRCQWTTGTPPAAPAAAAHQPSVVGFDAGNRRNYVALSRCRA